MAADAVLIGVAALVALDVACLLEAVAGAHPASLYAATKIANERMAHVYAHQYRVPAASLRFFTVDGPWGRPNMAYWKFTDAMLAGRSNSTTTVGAAGTSPMSATW